MKNEPNPFLTPNYEAALEALTRGPMTSNQHGVLIRPVDQMAEAVRESRKATEGMRKVLEEMRNAAGRQECYVCGHELGQHLDKYGCEVGVGDPDIGAPCGCKGTSTSEDMRPEIEALARADAALAAYEEATRG